MRVVVEGGRVPAAFHERLNRELIEHFGVGQKWFAFFSGGFDVDGFIDAVEILAEVARAPVMVPRITDPTGRRKDPVIPVPDVEERINRAFQRFRFGYRMNGLVVHKIGSPALDAVVAAPALLAVQRPGWEEVERSFREALEHERAGESDDTLTAANAAVEAALKAIGMSGGTLKQLAQSFKKSNLVPGYLSNVAELLEDLLDRLQAARSTQGDAHGKGPGAPEVPQALADLSVYWAGAFIAYLAETVPSPEVDRESGRG